MSVPPPACTVCVHYDRTKPVTCAAFPVRIPDVIWLEGDPHTEPIKGDHGIRFDLIDHAADTEDDDE